MKAIVFGAYGQLGTEISKLLIAFGVSVEKCSSNDCNFTSENIAAAFRNLRLEDFQIVINCAGVIDNETRSFDEIFKINVQSNFEIFDYFDGLEVVQPVNIFVIGSTAANSPRRAYPIYAASKTALYNLTASYEERFNGSMVTVNHVMLEKFGTQMGSGNTLPPTFLINAIRTFEENLLNKLELKK